MICEITSLQEHHSTSEINKIKIMEMRRDNNRMSFNGSTTTQAPMKSKQEYFRTLSSQNNPRRLISASYFSLESMFVLICLTASLLILPLILPPLPPPPFMLLLVPIGIMVLLMVLAFMPSSNAKHVSCSYM